MTNPSGPPRPPGGRYTPDYKNVPVPVPTEVAPEVPKLIDVLIADMIGEGLREAEQRDKKPLFHPKKRP